MAYRFGPGTPDVEKLCALLEERLPAKVEYKFSIEDGEVLRLRLKYQGRYYEKLLRDSDTPEAAVEGAMKALAIPLVQIQTSN